MRNYLLLLTSDGSVKLVSESTLSVHFPFQAIAILSVSERHLPLSIDDLSILSNSFDSILKDNL